MNNNPKPMKPAPTGIDTALWERGDFVMPPSGVVLVHRVMALLHGDSPITPDYRRDMAQTLGLALDSLFSLKDD